MVYKNATIIVILLLFIHSVHSQLSFTVASASASPNNAASSNSQYSILLNAITSFTTNFDVSLSFTSAFSITSVSNCKALLNGSTISTATCAVSSNSIVFSQLNINSTVSSLFLQFNTSTALYSGSFIVAVSYYQPGNSTNNYNSNSALISITSASMACSITSSSSIVGATTNYTFTLSPSVTIAAASILQIQFPGWSAYTLTNFPSFTSASVCGGQCSIRSPNTAQSFFNQILTYSNLYSTSSNSSRTLTLANGRNPASSQSISITGNLLYFINSTSQPAYMNCTTTFTASTPATFNAVTFSPTNLTISASNTISLLLNLTNPISSISYLQISYSSDLQLGYSYVTSNQQTTQLTYSTSQPNTILIGNLTNATNQFTALFMASFTLINAPYATLSNSITFMTMNYVGSTYFQTDSRTINVSASISAINSATASMLNSSIGIVSNINVTFISINTLVSGSKIIVTLPTQISFTNTSTCSSNISSTCSLFNTTAVIVNLNTPVTVGGTNFAITITNTNNPSTTTPTSSFTINTYYTNTSTPVDTLTSNLTLTATAVTMQSSSVNVSSVTVASNSSYTITFQNRNVLPSSSHIIITFPVQLSNSVNAALSSFKSAATFITTCTMIVLSNIKFRLNGCIPNTLSANTTSTIVIANIINPLSTKPTSSITLQTYFNSNLMEYTTTGLTVTMITPTGLTYFAMTPTNSTANQITTYTLSATFTQTHYSGDKLLLSFPSSIILLGSFQCTTTTAGITITCFTINSSLLQITLTGSVITNAVTVSITRIQNNWFAGNNIFTLQTTTNDSLTYYVQQATASVTITASTLITTYTPSNSLVLLSTSTISITITSPFTINAPTPNLLAIRLIVPTEFTPTSTCTTSISGAVCSLNGSTYSVTGLSSFTNTINILFTATATYFTISSVFTAALTYNSSSIATASSLTVTPYCTNPCRGCTSNATQCTSCLPSPYASQNNLFVPNSTCVSNCPSGYYLPSTSTTCAQCNISACLTCTTTGNTCTSCLSPTYLMNTSCLLVCPNTYYGSGTSCVPCTNQCYNCSNATYCLTCVSGYSLNPDNTCGLSCPIKYISLSGICTICTTPCATCNSSVTKCTSCLIGYILYNNTCILACPLGQFQDSNNLCQNCITPCKFCTSALTCVSCVSSYYIYNTTQCVAICPSGTYTLTSSCANCTNTCQTCSNVATNCTSCQSGLYLYMSTCYSICPTDTYPYQGTCTNCVSPCNTCLNGAFSCSTCIADYYLLNTSCVTSCPSTGYTTIDDSCVACPSNCITCSSSTTCSICTSGYYLYQGGCIVQCPSTSPIIVNSACTSCSSQCATCQQTPTNCLTCTLYYFKYSYSCVQSCPLSYFSNQLTYSCQSGLSSKIVFFPVLITYLVVIVFLIIVRIFSQSTSLPTVLTALSGWMELAVWYYLLSLIFATYLQPGVEYSISRALLLIAILTTLICNVIHFKVNYPRLQQDEYITKWQDINLNHSFLIAIRYIALFTHHKFFRLIYSKIFGSIHLSMVAIKPTNIFFISTIFSIISLAFSQLLVLVAAFYLAYNKLLKDQVFYTSVQTLIVTVISILLSLIDIYKPKDYFEDTQFMQTKRYLQKVNNDSMNKLEDQYRAKQEGSVDGQKIMGMTSGKFVFTRRGNTADAGSLNDILFEQQSAATDAHQTIKKIANLQIEDIEMLDSDALNQKSLNSLKEITSAKSPRSPLLKSNRQHQKQQTKINIFQPIQQEQGEYYEVLKYDESDFMTAAKIEQQKEGNGSQQQNQLENQRKQQFGVQTQSINDDNMSLMEYRQRRQQWNRIIDHRKNLAQQIFNTIDTKELYKIDQPVQQEEQKEESSPVKQRPQNRTPERVRRRIQAKNTIMNQSQLKLEKWLKQRKAQNYNSIEQQMVEDEQPRRRRRVKKPKKTNKQLQQIYLQRLAEKVSDPKRKTAYASTKNFKYEF